MKLTFLGTRGYVEPKSRSHRRHTATLVSYRGRSVLLDYGEDWRGMAKTLGPRAIVLTHAHPDHAFGLRDGAPCPVYATSPAWASLARFPVPPEQRRVLSPWKPTVIENIRFVPFPVVHSIRAPAVGYRITAGRVSIFYVPDVVRILRLRDALAGIQIYVGDGATVARPLLRTDKRTGSPIGHASIVNQLDWCASQAVPKMIVTHCGSQVVREDTRRVKRKLKRLAGERGVGLEIAHDGTQFIVR